MDLKKVAEFWCDTFEKYSKPPIPVDRLLPEYRVANDDLTRQFPDLHFLDLKSAEFQSFLKKEMQRRGLSFKR